MNRLSVVITTMNNAETIRECIERVLKAPPHEKELLIVYGKSGDRTEQIIQKYNDRAKIYQDDFGTGSAINTGTLHSCGDIIFFVEGHSFVSSTIFTKTLKAFEENESVGYIIFRRYVPSNFKGNKCQELINFWRKTMKGSTMGQFRAFRRKTFFDAGGFWTFPIGADDLEFATRLYQKGWKIDVLVDPSWDIPRKSFYGLFKHEIKAGSSEYLWYEIYKNHPYALIAYGGDGHFLQKQSLIILYNMFLKKFLAPITAGKISYRYKNVSFIPFYLMSQAGYILGFVAASIFWRHRQKWINDIYKNVKNTFIRPQVLNRQI